MSENPGVRDPGGRSDWIDWLEQRLHVSELFSFLSHFGFVYTPVDTRRPFREVLHDVATRSSSSYLQWPRILGVLTTVLFGVLAVSGVLLACYYQPTPETAHASTRLVARDLPMGWLVRQVHAWGAWLLIVVVVLRLARFFWDGLYRAPRELLWGSMVAMAWVVVQLDFTGRLLPWTQSGYWSVTRGLEVIHHLPVVGPVFTFLGGGASVDGIVLLRFYVLHTMVLPVVFLALFFLTFATVRRVGLTEARAAAMTSTGRDHFYALASLFLVVFGALSTLAVVVPLPFGAEANPLATPANVMPPWYLALPAILRDRLPMVAWLVAGLFVLSTLAVLLLPAWAGRARERTDETGFRRAGVIAAAVWVVLTAVGLWLERGR